MKKFIFSVSLFSLVSFGMNAQNGICADNIKVDLTNATINKVKLTASMVEVKAVFPCWSAESEENEGGVDCGGGVSFFDYDIYFFTNRDYVEIRTGFKGELSDKNILNADVNEVMKKLGNPDAKVVPQGDGEPVVILYFKRDYGCMRLNYSPTTGKITEIGLHAKPVEEAKMDLCL